MAIVNRGEIGGLAVLTFAGNGYTNLKHLEVTGESVSAARISNVFWAANNDATWVVSRGGNTVLTLSGSGERNYEKLGIPVELFNHAQGDQGNVGVQLISNGLAKGTLLIRMNKISTEDLTVVRPAISAANNYYQHIRGDGSSTGNPAVAGDGPAVGDGLLLEVAGYLLLENGDFLLLE